MRKREDVEQILPLMSMGSVRSLRAGMDELVVLMGDRRSVKFFETWLQEHALDSSVSLRGFKMIQVDSAARRGRSALRAC